MQQGWDYKVVWIGIQGHDSFLWRGDDGEVLIGKWDSLSIKLRAYGSAGWELVSDVAGLFPGQMRSRLIFKKPR